MIGFPPYTNENQNKYIFYLNFLNPNNVYWHDNQWFSIQWILNSTKIISMIKETFAKVFTTQIFTNFSIRESLYKKNRDFVRKNLFDCSSTQLIKKNSIHTYHDWFLYIFLVKDFPQSLHYLWLKKQFQTMKKLPFLT